MNDSLCYTKKYNTNMHLLSHFEQLGVVSAFSGTIKQLEANICEKTRNELSNIAVYDVV